MLALMTGVMYYLLLLFTSITYARDSPYYFPSSTTEPVRFNISVDRNVISHAAAKANIYRPSLDLADETNLSWLEGPPRANMTALAEHWAESYDWTTAENTINDRFLHYALTVEAGAGYNHTVPLHFVHERSTDQDALPLLILHGWPSTNLEWADVIGPLVSSSASGGQSYHVVAPDLPGMGFSPAPTASGLNASELAVVFDNLMKRLGYSSYGVISTDLGWWIASWMAQVVPDSLIGHYTDFFLIAPNTTDIARAQNNTATPQELQYIAALTAWSQNHTAYSTVHTQSPLLVGQALTDSPVGFAGWVWHLCYAVSDGYQYTLDQIIERTLLLWIQGTWGGLRLYRELYGSLTPLPPKTKTPTGVSLWSWVNGPYPELANPHLLPRDWIERYVNLTHLTVQAEGGGHFPAQNRPDAWVADVRQFFSTLG